MATIQIQGEGQVNNVEVVPLNPSGSARGPPTEKMTDGPMCKVDTMQISQKGDDIEIFTGGCCERQNRYKISVPGQGKVYKAKEESSCCARMCFGPHVDMKIHINEDEDGYEDYLMEKPFDCGCFYALGGICRPQAKIFRKKDMKLVGRVQRPVCGGVFRPTLDIFDGNNVKTGQVKGPMCCISPFCESAFQYYDLTQQETGAKITREYPGCCKVCCTDMDDFEMKFASTQDEDARATMIGTMLLLDYMHFEDDKALEICTADAWCKLKLGDLYCCGCTIPYNCKIPKNSSE